jgi:small nuclear ribonucleoprotein (snRNP)-like protein
VLTYSRCWCLLLQGIFRGYDQVTNVILENCCELAFSTTVSTPLEQQPKRLLFLWLSISMGVAARQSSISMKVAPRQA